MPPVSRENQRVSRFYYLLEGIPRRCVVRASVSLLSESPGKENRKAVLISQLV